MSEYESINQLRTLLAKHDVELAKVRGEQYSLKMRLEDVGRRVAELEHPVSRVTEDVRYHPALMKDQEGGRE